MACRMPKKMKAPGIATHVIAVISAAAPATRTRRLPKLRHLICVPCPSHRLSPARNRNDPAVPSASSRQPAAGRGARREPAEKAPGRRRNETPAIARSAADRARSTARTRPAAPKRSPCRTGFFRVSHGTGSRSCALSSRRCPVFPLPRLSSSDRYLAVIAPPHGHGHPHRPAYRRTRAVAGALVMGPPPSRVRCSTACSATRARSRWPRRWRRAPAHAVMEATARLIARRVNVEGLSHIPATGGALIVAKPPHRESPTGWCSGGC